MSRSTSTPSSPAPTSRPAATWTLIVKAITDFHLGPRPTEGDGYGTVNEARAVAAAVRPVIDEARSDGYTDGYGDGQEYAEMDCAEQDA